MKIEKEEHDIYEPLEDVINRALENATEERKAEILRMVAIHEKMNEEDREYFKGRPERNANKYRLK